MIDRNKALATLPQTLRDELFDEFDKITRNYRGGRWEASELDGGRFSEIVYSILKGYGSGNYPSSASKPSNMKASCEALEQIGAQFPRSVRITIPRILVPLYEVRNNRGVGHIGGDVNSNHMDAEFVLHSAQWVMAELVRIFHGLTVDEATAAVDALVERTAPTIWKIGDKKRVLRTELPLADKALLLVYSTVGSVEDKVLGDWLELDSKALSNFKARVLKPLHAKKWIEYAKDGSVTLSPNGTADVEARLL
ncbi:hypothetical protein [Mycobacteroides abscessus]|uniref:hypothetical protein n=1 Tax=Mycobacteroides abscessus TaxID=36809 RepID=UPI000C26703D|nr:hypothetical protein [Mycobacteroides abscessus]